MDRGRAGQGQRQGDGPTQRRPNAGSYPRAVKQANEKQYDVTKIGPWLMTQQTKRADATELVL